MANGAWAQYWEESERGWGTRPDGVYYFSTKQEAEEQTAARLKELRAVEKDLYGGQVPDEYSRPSGPPEFVPVNQSILEDIHHYGFAHREKW